MIETNISSIDINALMRTIHEKVQASSKKSSSFITSEIPSFAEHGAVAFEDRMIPVKEQYSIQDFSGLTNEDFIVNACRVILRREPNDGEFLHILASLERGELTRSEVLGNFRFSPEGKSKKVNVKGAYLFFLIHRASRVPGLGKVVQILSCVYRLPMLFKNVLQLNTNVSHINSNIETKLNKERYVHGLRAVIQSINDLEQKLISWQQSGEQKTDSLLRGFSERQQAEFDDFLSDIDRVKQEITSVAEGLVSEAVSAVHEELAIRLPDIASLQRTLRKIEKNSGAEKHPLQAESLNRQEQGSEFCNTPLHAAQLDSLYIAFENRFRGKTEDVYNRLQAYTPYIQEVSQALPGGTALDVGCGRGEWLDVLQDAKIPAVGVDLNECMLENARARGLNVVCEDLFDYLHDVVDDSLSIITGFHIVEHLPFSSLVLLIDEALRTLQDGGMVIFETPNPENLVTGACNFYLDPTHKNPIPPQLLEFLLKARGFSQVEILRLHPNDSVQLNEQVLQDILFGPQDYAILGWK